MKVRYVNGKCRAGVTDFFSTAYLDTPALPDGSYTGTNKHSDEFVHLRWDDEAEVWRMVCERVYLPYNAYVEAPPGPEDLSKRPPCTCWSADDQ